MTAMKNFEALSHLGQVRRLRLLAQQALDAYNLQNAEFHLLQHAENTTFQVDSPVNSPADQNVSTLYHPNRFLLRIHRPSYQNEASIASELLWLAALRGADLPVPEPVPNANGDLFTIAGAPCIPAPRVCSLLRWMKGRFYEENPQPRHLEAVGRLMAQLHTQSLAWQRPPAFTRRRWDSTGLFGDNGGFNLPIEQIWDLIPGQFQGQFHAVVERASAVMASLDTAPGSSGLIHADLHLGNVLFARDAATGCLQARPIDFDDCGFAHWAYDFAAALGDFRADEPYPVFRDALLSGYAEVRPLPLEQLKHLDTFIAARLVSLMLWVTDMAQVNHSFAPNLERWYAWAAEGITKCKVS